MRLTSSSLCFKRITLTALWEMNFRDAWWKAERPSGPCNPPGQRLQWLGPGFLNKTVSVKKRGQESDSRARKERWVMWAQGQQVSSVLICFECEN